MQTENYVSEPNQKTRVLFVVCFVKCASRSVLRVVCFTKCASRGVLREVCFAKCASRGVFRVVCFAWCASRGVLRVVCFGKFSGKMFDFFFSGNIFPKMLRNCIKTCFCAFLIDFGEILWGFFFQLFCAKSNENFEKNRKVFGVEMFWNFWKIVESFSTESWKYFSQIDFLGSPSNRSRSQLSKNMVICLFWAIFSSETGRKPNMLDLGTKMPDLDTKNAEFGHRTTKCATFWKSEIFGFYVYKSSCPLACRR